MHRLSTLIIAVGIVAVACTPAADTTSTPASSAAGSVAGSSSSVTSTIPATSPPTTETPSTSLTLPAGTEDLPEDVRRRIAELVATTEQLRGLTFTQPPVITVVTPEELATRVREQVTEDAENVDADQALYRLLDLIGPDVDLAATYADLYGEQVAGFYDGDTKELVIPAAAEALSPLEEATLVHELTHALTDQRYGMWDRYSEMLDADEFDAAEAYLGLIEGDAVLTEILYIQQLPERERGRLLAESLGAETDVFDRVPLFLQQTLLFPYQDGLGFVQRLYGEGGFDAIGAAYQDPPLSTEQILHPRDYRRDLPLAVTVPDWEAPSGYEQVYDATWGELGLEAMFAQNLDGATATVAAEGWGGDRYRLWFDGEDVVFAYVYEGDTAADAEELREALSDYLGGLDVPPAQAFVRRDQSTVVFVAVSDPELADLSSVFVP